MSTDETKPPRPVGRTSAPIVDWTLLTPAFAPVEQEERPEETYLPKAPAGALLGPTTLHPSVKLDVPVEITRAPNVPVMVTPNAPPQLTPNDLSPAEEFDFGTPVLELDSQTTIKMNVDSSSSKKVNGGETAAADVSNPHKAAIGLAVCFLIVGIIGYVLVHRKRKKLKAEVRPSIFTNLAPGGTFS
mmetsp:Transcript_16454/g.27883  ORF Transcript_16454/g.27883 Transcript_16454/m.27883 type:complete len:187 (-) Transcript_16454:182-742(-)